MPTPTSRAPTRSPSDPGGWGKSERAASQRPAGTSMKSEVATRREGPVLKRADELRQHEAPSTERMTRPTARLPAHLHPQPDQNVTVSTLRGCGPWHERSR
jgi:hypothetical protein